MFRVVNVKCYDNGTVTMYKHFVII